MSKHASKSRLEDLAIAAALLAFRHAWNEPAEKDQACAKALKTYLTVHPDDDHASEQVVEALAELIRSRPDALETAPSLPAPPPPARRARHMKLRWRSRLMRNRLRIPIDVGQGFRFEAI